MARRRRASDGTGNGCRFCTSIRVFIAFAVLVVLALAFSDSLEPLQGVHFTDLFGYLMGLLFIAVLALKAYQEWVLPKRQAQEREARRLKREQLLAELDAAEGRADAAAPAADEPRE